MMFRMVRAERNAPLILPDGKHVKGDCR